MPPVVPLNTQYRLSRVYNGGVQQQTYNRVILYAQRVTANGQCRFVEGFDATEFIVDSGSGTYNFRRQNSSPQMLYSWDIFKVVGSIYQVPQIRSQLSLTPGPMGVDVNKDHNIFSCKLRDVDASHGEELDAWNCTSLGTNTDINFYDRDVQTVNKQRNVLGARARITPTPESEEIADPFYLDKI